MDKIAFPSGTVTFLFTDIEGSTQLLSQLRDKYATLLSDQRRILREAFVNWQGQEVDTPGDEASTIEQVAFPKYALDKLALLNLMVKPGGETDI